MILPATLSDVGSMIALAMNVIKRQDGAANGVKTRQRKLHSSLRLAVAGEISKDKRVARLRLGGTDAVVSHVWKAAISKPTIAESTMPPVITENSAPISARERRFGTDRVAVRCW